ncbi:beta-lactamase family protein [Paenibacillus sp. J5C_2022]|uniref:serine hydrolase domain-containing protein n=1 Tax=Paenibacillus sp. J5C2022 TaxID=2977129 RepID=UPI0021D0EC50|nr:serine hydrolase domain-containing protein [Paenibacillus sp. J5C2022]MCU6708269.1 beta-lactamase family protein [Paenibacillus sp. J5C2022]
MTTDSVHNIEQFMEKYIARWPFSGVILAARGSDVVVHRAYGRASLELDVPIDIHTKFRIWSVTKSFTAMAIMQLYEQGKLSLDDPLYRYLPELSRHDAITIRHALQHESGLRNFTMVPEFNSQLNKIKLAEADFFELLNRYPLDFEPGSSFSYNNTGYYLLGVVIERVSGQSFENYVTKHILHPLDMMETGIDTGDKLIPAMASPYTSSGDGMAPGEFIDMGNVSSAGGMFSTTGDLFKWARAIHEEKLLSPRTYREAFGNSEAKYGMGWFLKERGGRRRVFHGGAYRGFRSELHRYPDDELTVIVLTNYDIVPATYLADTMSDILLGEDASVPDYPPAVPLSETQFQRYRGTYEDFGCKAVVDRDGEELYFLWNDRHRVPFYPIGEHQFHHKWGHWPYSFKEEDDGALSFLGMRKTAGPGASGS